MRVVFKERTGRNKEMTVSFNTNVMDDDLNLKAFLQNEGYENERHQLAAFIPFTDDKAKADAAAKDKAKADAAAKDKAKADAAAKDKAKADAAAKDKAKADAAAKDKAKADAAAKDKAKADAAAKDKAKADAAAKDKAKADAAAKDKAKANAAAKADAAAKDKAKADAAAKDKAKADAAAKDKAKNEGKKGVTDTSGFDLDGLFIYYELHKKQITPKTLKNVATQLKSEGVETPLIKEIILRYATAEKSCAKDGEETNTKFDNIPVKDRKSFMADAKTLWDSHNSDEDAEEF